MERRGATEGDLRALVKDSQKHQHQKVGDFCLVGDTILETLGIQQKFFILEVFGRVIDSPS